jgi:hypothetical protein
MNYGKQTIPRRSGGWAADFRLEVGERGEWWRVAKSAAGGTTNQIFTPAAARSRGPLLLFICKAGLNYGAGKAARWILQDHCTACWPEASLYH